MKKFYLIPLTLLLIGTGCKKENLVSISQPVLPHPVPVPQVANRPPVANAGSDLSITLPHNVARIDGSMSTDPDGAISSYLWTIIAGPGLSNMYNFDVDAKPSVKYAPNLIEGVYMFELTVTDNKGLRAKDTVQITVLPDPFVTNPALFTRFNKVPRAIGCDRHINNIASYLPAAAAIKVFVRAHNNLLGSGGWVEASKVIGTFFRYEITNNVLIIRYGIPFDCDQDINEYDVLVKWD